MFYCGNSPIPLNWARRDQAAHHRHHCCLPRLQQNFFRLFDKAMSRGYLGFCSSKESYMYVGGS
jgi:hypothetical protein